MAQITTVELSSMLNGLRLSNSPETLHSALSVFLKLIANIIASPSDARFKIIKKSNKIISEQWLPCKGILDIAYAVGYEAVDDSVLSFVGELENLHNLKQAIEAVMAADPMSPGRESALDSKSHQGSQALFEMRSNVASHKELHKETPESGSHHETAKPIIVTKVHEAAKPVIEESRPKPHAEPIVGKKPHEIKPVEEKEPDSRLEWSGSSYTGPMKDGWFQGKGRFRFPSGVIYEGDFHKGEFHGKGTLIFPNGGKYIAEWKRGRAESGTYEYYDGLTYKAENWDYCKIPDRRFYTEIKEGLRPAGATLLVNDPNGPKAMVPGTYDVGEGYFDMSKNMVFSYEDQELGPPEDTDLQEIIEKYRYNPSNL